MLINVRLRNWLLLYHRVATVDIKLDGLEITLYMYINADITRYGIIPGEGIHVSLAAKISDSKYKIRRS